MENSRAEGCVLYMPMHHHLFTCPACSKNALDATKSEFTVHASLLRCECHYLHAIGILEQVTAKVPGTKARVADAVTWFGIGSELRSMMVSIIAHTLTSTRARFDACKGADL
jgi:hypothetical protein